MTIEEVIRELSKIKDKKGRVWFDGMFGMEQVTSFRLTHITSPGKTDIILSSFDEEESTWDTI